MMQACVSSLRCSARPLFQIVVSLVGNFLLSSRCLSVAQSSVLACWDCYFSVVSEMFYCGVAQFSSSVSLIY